MYQVKACSNSLDSQHYSYLNIRNEITEAHTGQGTCSRLHSLETWRKDSHVSTLGPEVRL